jgi:hypothetical protein
MLLPLSAAAIMAGVLLWELALPRLRVSLPQLAHELAARHQAHRASDRSRGTLASGEHPRFCQHGYDPGRELRAEQRARELLFSCVNEEEWAMYRDLGFLRVWAPSHDPTGSIRFGSGRGGAGTLDGSAVDPRCRRKAEAAPRVERACDGAPYAYLLYPHKPIVAYVPQTGGLLNEYCVAFPDETRPYGSARLPDADDVLAKWMALTADERRLIADANMHLPGRQVDPRQVREDLARLARWERERAAASARHRGASTSSEDGGRDPRLRGAAASGRPSPHRLMPGPPGGWRSRPEAGDRSPPAPSFFI